MKLWKDFSAHIVWIGLLLCNFPAVALPTGGQHGAEPDSTTTSVAGQQRASLDELPDSPSAVRARQQETEKQQSNPETQSSSPPPAEHQTEDPQTQSQTSLPSPQKPVGTAVAEPLRVSGIAASQPAGVAIAPAKQHRARTIVLSMGAIVCAGVAVGTVVALTQATPSKPPGAR